MGNRIYGLDVSSPVTPEQWEELKGRGAQFVVVRAWRDANGGEPDAGCPDIVAAAWQAGLAQVDVYAFPSQRKQSAAQQATEVLAFLQKNGVTFGRLWFDVEGETTGSTWWPDPAENLAYITAFVSTVAAAGVTCGIYCSTAGWKTITGDSAACGQYPLWWSSHGKDFTPFGGWTAATMVQYAYDTSHFGLVYDSDYLDT